MRYPKDQREARIWNFLNNQDHIRGIRYWPDYLQVMAMKDHKSYRERYRLILFFLWNGLSPILAHSWTIMKDYRNGVIPWRYDVSAQNQFKYILRKHLDGALYHRRLSVYDLNERRVVGPNHRRHSTNSTS